MRYNGPNAAAQNPPLDDGFIVREGKYVLFDGAVTVRVWDDKQFRRIKWSMFYPQPSFKNGGMRSTETLTLDLRPGTPWFLYAASADEIWCYDGEVTLQVSERIRTTEEPPATPEDDPRAEKGKDRIRYFSSDDLPSWGNILEHGLPPEKVLQRLPKKLRPAAVQEPFPIAAKPSLPNPHMPDGFIVSPGDYNLHGGLVKVKVWNEAGMVQWRSTWATHMSRLGTFGPTSLGPAVSQTKWGMRWFLYPESGTRIWSFDGKSKVSLYKHSYEDPLETFVNGKSVITRPGVGTVEIDLPNEKLLLAQKPPKAVLQHLSAELRTTSDGFVDTLGEFQIVPGALNVGAHDDRGLLTWSIRLPPDPPHRTGTYADRYGTEAPINSPWFVYVESPERYWQFDGKGLIRRHTIAFGNPPPGSARLYTSIANGSRWEQSRVDAQHEVELLKLAPPKPVLARLQPWLRPQDTLLPAVSPPLKDGYIVAVGEYKFHNGATTVKVWEHKGMIFWSVSMPPKISKGVWSPSSTLKRESRWMLYLESPEQIWSFDGASTVTRNWLSETKPTKTMQNGKLVDSVSTGVSTTIAKLPDQLKDLVSWNPPVPVLRWLPEELKPQVALQQGPKQSIKPAHRPALQDGCIVAVGEYKFFNGRTTVKVRERDGMIDWSVELPPEAGRTGDWAGMSLRGDLPWKLLLESPERIWSFDGWSTVTRSTLTIGQPKKTLQDGRLVETPGGVSVSTPIIRIPSQQKELLQWNAPEAVRRWIPLGNDADLPPRKTSGIPNLPAKTPQADGFVTSTGEYKLFEGAMKLKVWEKQGMVNWRLYRPNRNVKLEGEDTMDSSGPAEPQSKLEAPWFLFPESADSLWFYDGAKKIWLARQSPNKPPLPEGTNTSSVQADLPTWDAKEYGDPPEKVLQRLPPALRPRHR